jgi:predicted PurR-regulated permease PerM
MLERLVLPPWLRLGLALPLLVLNLWVLRQLLLPLAPFPALFLTAALFAFLLDIPARWLMGRGTPRPLALLLVLGLSLSLVATAAFWLVPRLVEQLADLVAALPGWLAEGETLLQNLQEWATQRGLPTDFGDLSSELLSRTSKLATQLSQRLLSLLGATLSITINSLIVLVLAVFLLLGGERISLGLAEWLPPRGAAPGGQHALPHLPGLFRRSGGAGPDPQHRPDGPVHPAGDPLWRAVRRGDRLHHPDSLRQRPHDCGGERVAGPEDPRTGLEVLVSAITVGQVVDQVIQPRLMGSIVGLQPAWLVISLPIGARLGALLGLGELLGLLLAVPAASCTKTFLDAWAARLRLPAMETAPGRSRSQPEPGLSRRSGVSRSGNDPLALQVG